MGNGKEEAYSKIARNSEGENGRDRSRMESERNTETAAVIKIRVVQDSLINSQKNILLFRNK